MNEIQKILVISTGHLPHSTMQALDGTEPVLPDQLPLHASYDYGVFVWCDTDNGWNTERFPELKAVIDYAAKLDCQWVRFDRDADYVSGLPRWSW
jgi:hypothetical protein